MTLWWLQYCLVYGLRKPYCYPVATCDLKVPRRCSRRSRYVERARIVPVQSGWTLVT